MTIDTTGQLIEALKQFDPKTRIAMIHCGTQTFAPWLLRILTMYETRDDEVSRGEVDENVAHAKSDDFPDAITVIEAGW